MKQIEEKQTVAGHFDIAVENAFDETNECVKSAAEADVTNLHSRDLPSALSPLDYFILSCAESEYHFCSASGEGCVPISLSLHSTGCDRDLRKIYSH